MGNNGGIMFNQSQEDLVYILHTTDKEASKAKNQNQDSKENSQIVHPLKAGRISRKGLKKVDFNVLKFISIRKTDGSQIANKIKVVNEESLGIKVRPDLSVKMMAKDQTDKLKEFADGAKIKEGSCTGCKNGAYLAQYDKEIQCRSCKKDFKELWVCKFKPQNNAYCNFCHQQRQKQAQEVGK